MVFVAIGFYAHPRVRSHVVMTQAPRFCRGSDLLSVGPYVSEVDIVNVLGRWKTYKDWDTIGELIEMDKLFDADGVPLKKLEPWSEMINGKRLFSLTKEEQLLVSPARSPNRRGWCKRNGQVQRWWHNANVPLLSFKSSKLAACVGKSVSEMNQMAVNPVALDVVFDALSRSQSGILPKAVCDSRRASYELPTGEFDVKTFQNDLATARRTVAQSYAVYPGSLQLVGVATFVKGASP